MKSVNTKNLAEVLLESTDGVAPEETKKALCEFAEYLAKKNLTGITEEIFSQYRILYNKKHNIIEATVTLVNRLPENTRIELREALKKKFKAREVHMLEKVDERIIAGMKIQVGDTVYDSSLQNTLYQLKAQLLK